MFINPCFIRNIRSIRVSIKFYDNNSNADFR